MSDNLLVNSAAFLDQSGQAPRLRTSEVAPGVHTLAVNQESGKATYSFSVNSFAPTAQGDIITIQGSASKIVRVTRVELSGLNGTAGMLDVYALRRTTANTGGTSTAPTAIIRHDSADPAPTASPLVWTTPGSSSAGSGLMRSRRVFFPAGPAEAGLLTWNFGDGPGKGFVLRGASEWFALFLGNGAPGFGTPSLSISVEWTEE